MEDHFCDLCETFNIENEYNMIYECEKCGLCICKDCQGLGYIQSMDCICKDCFNYECENLPNDFYLYDEHCINCNECIIKN